MLTPFNSPPVAITYSVGIVTFGLGYIGLGPLAAGILCAFAVLATWLMLKAVPSSESIRDPGARPATAAWRRECNTERAFAEAKARCTTHVGPISDEEDNDHDSNGRA